VIIHTEDVVLVGSEIVTRRHKIAGAVTVDGAPAERVVMVMNRRNFTYIGATLSDPTTGDWEITGLQEYQEGTLLVIAMDTTGAYNAEVADYVSQVATT